MNVLAGILIAALAAPALAADRQAPQLPSIDAGSILAQIEQQNHFPQPQPIISPDMQFALEAASELRKDLKGYGIKAKVGLVNEPKGGYGLWVEFRNWSDYEQVKDLFYQDPGENPSYMDLKVYPRVPKGVEDRAARNWKSVGLQAADGTRIIVNYTPLDLGDTMMASPVWVTVANKSFRGDEKVKAAVMTYYEATSASAEALKETKEISLEYNGTAFQAKGPDLSVYEGHHAWTHHFRQEIAVSVNGRWLTDPVNGSHNFRFKLNSREADTKGGERIKACWLKSMEKDVCVYKCKDGSTYTQPMQRPLPWNDTPVLPCPQLVFPF